MSAAAWYLAQVIKEEIYGTELPQVVPLVDGTWVRLTDGRIGIIRNWEADVQSFIVEMWDSEFGAYAWELIALSRISHAINC